MAKNIKEQTRVRPAAAKQLIIPQKFQHSAAILFLYVCLLIFFHSIVFEGKTYQAADSVASHSWETLTKDAQAEGIFPLWNPYIFCGMPGFASLTFTEERWQDVPQYFNKARLYLGYLFVDQSNGTWLFFYLIYGIGVYFFTFFKLKNKPVALIVALMSTYATYIAILIMIGHITKIAVLAWFPYVFLLVEKIREQFKFLFLFLLAIVVRLMIEPGHVQFIFLIYLALGSYLLFLFVRSMIKKENWRNVLIAGSSLIVATILAFLMGADQHFSTLEYNPYSIRGSNPIVHSSVTAQTKTVEGGLDYDYATNWSFSPGEMMTFFVPSWYGFGTHPYNGPLTQNRETRLYTYLGPQPSVDGPQYMGVIVVILAIIGFIKYRKEPFVQFMGAAVVFSLFLSFGREFSFLYDLMYKYFPLFNKFRNPSISLMLVQVFTPLLAGFGIMSFLSEQTVKISPQVEKRRLFIVGGLLFGLVFTMIGKTVIQDIYRSFFSLQEVGTRLSQSYGQLDPAVVGLFYDFIVGSVITDIMIGFILLTIVIGAFFYFQKGKLKSTTLYSLLLVAVLFDLWRVAWKPSEPKNRQESVQEMPTPEYVKVLLQDTTQFRVLKVVDGQPVYGDNSLAYWRIQNAFGYHGAKMRIFQDMADVAGMGNPLVWHLMNVKYLITNRDESSPALAQVYNSPERKVYAIRSWLPRVFFVNRCEVADGLSILNKIAALSFDPRDVAYVSAALQEKIDPPTQGVEANIVHYGLHKIEIQATSTGNNLLFISEAYYPKGWKAYLDGKEIDILRLNYLFRGVIIPQGTHTLLMKFEPASYSLGSNISLATNLLVLLGIVIQGTVLLRKKKSGGTLQS